MHRQLLILRHAKSAWDTDAASDFDRPLAKRGRKDAPRMGKWLRKSGLTPDYVISSPALRAQQTAIEACKAMGIDRKQIHWEPRLYGAGAATLLAVLGACPAEPATVMIVGHNPGLEMLLQHLCGGNTPVSADGKLLPTATVARLRMPEVWDNLPRGAADRVAITRPRSLP